MSQYKLSLCMSCVHLLRESGYSVDKAEDRTELKKCSMCDLICGTPVYVVSKEAEEANDAKKD